MEARVSSAAKTEKGRNCGRDLPRSSARWTLPWNGDRKLKVTERSEKG